MSLFSNIVANCNAVRQRIQNIDTIRRGEKKQESRKIGNKRRKKNFELNNHKSIVNLCINIDADHDPAYVCKQQNANSDLFLCCDLLRALTL